MKKFTFKSLNLNRKFFYTYAFLLTSILLLFTSILYFVLYTQNRQQNTSSYLELLSSIETQVDTSISTMQQDIFALAINEQFRTVTGSGENQIAFYTQCNNTLLDIFITLDAPLLNYHRIIAFNDYAYYNYSKVAELPNLISAAIKNYPWNDKLLEVYPLDFIIPPHIDDFGADEKIVYSVTRKIPSFIDNSITTVEIQNDYKILESFYSIDDTLGNIVVITTTGELVYPYGNEEIDTNFYLDLFLENQDNDSQVSYQNNSYIYFSQSESTAWITFLISNPQSELSLGFTLGIYFIVIFILLFLFILFLVQISTNRLLQPLENLNQSIKNVSLDNLYLSIPNSESLDEFEFINHSFQDMFAQLEKSFAETLQSKANEEHAYYLALEAQMNPHTIYNTISMIESVSYLNGDLEVSELCICFSEMLRYISDFTQTDYYLSDELAHLRNYAHLIEKRYAGALSISISVPEKVTNFK
ncbi:MAG: histidine kinase, partial [Eubacteriales bacterium]